MNTKEGNERKRSK